MEGGVSDVFKPCMNLVIKPNDLIKTAWFTGETIYKLEAFVLCHGLDHLGAYRGCNHRQLVLNDSHINHKMVTTAEYIFTHRFAR